MLRSFHSRCFRTLLLLAAILQEPCFAAGDVPIERVFPAIDSSYVISGRDTLQVFTGGSGPCTLVFECGMGDNSKVWFYPGLFQYLMDSARVIAYNRAGHPPSTHGSGEPQDLEKMTRDLDAVITAKSGNGKVLLVGHSLGGAVIRHYAIRHPEKIRSLLFIDPSQEDYVDFAGLTPEKMAEMVEHYTRAGNAGGVLESAQLITDRTILETLPELPDVPVTVITSMKIPEGKTPADRQSWFSAHESLGKGIRDFTHISTTQSGHYIYLEEPRLVLDQILKQLR